jgi:hypothetical protein
MISFRGSEGEVKNRWGANSGVWGYRVAMTQRAGDVIHPLEAADQILAKVPGTGVWLAGRRNNSAFPGKASHVWRPWTSPGVS